MSTSVRIPRISPAPGVSVVGPGQEAQHSVVLKLDQQDPWETAAGWHSVVPVPGIGASRGLGWIDYSVVPVWMGLVWLELGIIVYMERNKRRDYRDRMDWTWVLPILWAMLIFILLFIS